MVLRTRCEPMRSYKQCTECRATNTDRVFIDTHTDQIEEVRVCDECGAQYSNVFYLEVQRTDDVPA